MLADLPPATALEQLGRQSIVHPGLTRRRRATRRRWPRWCGTRPSEEPASGSSAARHSFTPVVETDGLLLDLSGLRGVVEADPRSKRASALAGTLIRDFYEPLWREGLALKNQGDIDTQQIAGAVATATHGSGIRNKCLSGVVRGVRLVTATGEIRDIGESEPDLLRAAQVSIGMLGVMTRLELEVTDAYRLTEQVDLWPWDEVLERWDELVHEHRHFGFFWLPTEESAALYNLYSHGQTMADKCYVKIYDEAAPDQPDSAQEGRRDRSLLPDLPDGLRPELSRARVLRAAGTRARRPVGDARSDAPEPARLGLPARGAHRRARRRVPLPELPDRDDGDLGLRKAGHRLLGLPALCRCAARRSSPRACTGASCTS